jgi:glucosylglycerol-phosphate synthase
LRSLGIKSDRRSRSDRNFIPHGSKNPLAVAIDVELLARGRPDDTARLAKCLSERKQTTIIYTSETRSLTAMRVGARVLQLPPADAVIADAGASVDSESQHPGVMQLDESLAAKWIGSNILRKRLRHINHLVGEHSYEAARRYSCFPRGSVSVAEASAAIEKECAGAGLEISIVAGNRIDISPLGVNTGSTLLRLLEILDLNPTRTVVAGHYLGEELIARSGCWGVVTGEINPSVKASLVHCPRVHLTAAEGATGIRLGLEAFGFV